MNIYIAPIDTAYELASDLTSKWQLLASKYSPNRKKTFLAGRALLQKALQQSYGVDTLPEIISVEHEKPKFKDIHDIYFNLSHSAKHIVLSVGQGNQGIDLEFVKTRHGFDALKEKVLSKEEITVFSHYSDSLQLDTFTSLWTVREALLKTSGVGLVGLSRIALDLNRHQIRCEDNSHGFIHTCKFNSLIDAGPSYLSYFVDSVEPCFYTLKERLFHKIEKPSKIEIFQIN